MVATESSTIGVLIVAHGELAQGLAGAAHEILGEVPLLEALRLDPAAENPRQLVARTVEGLDAGAGVLALTDLFGGTPSNIALALCPHHKLEVVTGVNLPMLLRALTRRDGLELRALATEIAEYGQDQICLPNDLLVEK